MAPDDLGWRKNASANAGAIRVHINDGPALKSRDVAGSEEDISRIVVAGSEFTGIGFGLA